MKALPSTRGAQATLFIGIALLLFSMWAQARMWQVEFGLRPVAAGGGEYMVGLFIGLPTLLTASILLGILILKHQWRSIISIAAFCLCILPLSGWTVLVIRDIF